VFSSFAQNKQTSQVCSSQGGSSNAGGILITWTLGEVVYNTAYNSEIVLTQGFNQGAYDENENLPFLKNTDYNYTEFRNNTDESRRICVYPTLVKENLYIDVDLTLYRKLKCKIIDVYGRVLLVKNIKSSDEIINVSALSNQLYLIQFFNDVDMIETFKIQKIK
jgi:hypothetical protein